MSPSWRPFLRGLIKLGFHGATEKQVIERLAEERLVEMVRTDYFTKATATRDFLRGSTSTRTKV